MRPQLETGRPTRVDSGADGDLEDASAATATNKLREGVGGLFGAVGAEAMVEAVGEVLSGSGGEAA